MSNSLQSSSDPEVLRTVLAPGLLAGFPAEARAELIAAGRTRRVAAGQLIQQRGDPVGTFWLVESGHVRIGQFDPDGAFNAIAVLGPGDSFGELALLAGRRRVVDAVAVGPTRLRAIPAAALHRLARTNPAVASALIEALARQFHEALDLLAAFRRSNGAARLVRTLAVLVQDRPGPVRLALGQQALADLVGTSRMTVSTALASLERQGLIRRGYGWIEVDRPEALRALTGTAADPGPR
ncbi:MAG TPA: Crp/Fnr family transcriptional regulator [Novosphingobium sp.]|nr:Crp/Fnr family transcriptional regulator [Novosphingobium sp.]